MTTEVTERRVPIPEGVEVRLEADTVTVRHGETVLRRTLRHPRITLALDDGAVRVASPRPRKRERALVGTFAAHIANMIQGVQEPFVYTMKVVYAHFPVKVSVREEAVLIENFLGERHPRRASIRGQTQVQVAGDTLTLTGPDVEDVSQTAANVEQATRIKRKDPRVFQDGIFLVSKGAR